MRRLSASLEVFGADEVTLVGLGHTAMRADPVPPAPRSLARKDESIVVGDAVVVRALVLTVSVLPSAETTRCTVPTTFPAFVSVKSHVLALTDFGVTLSASGLPVTG